MSATRSTARVKACIECRQQKLRCDAHLSSQQVCSRCSRLGIQCIISDQFHRSKRQSKAEMQRELDQLRAQAKEKPSLEASSAQLEPPLAMTPGATPTAAPVWTRNSVDSPNAITAHLSPQSITSMPTSHGRTLDGVELSHEKISDCIALYFNHFHHWLPILEPSGTAEQYYTYSPLIFWTIVAVGSRRYSRDPTIMDRIYPKTVSLALQMCSNIPKYSEVIQSLIILCRWPPPSLSMYENVSHVLAGAAMQLGVQNGLHMFSVRQDFTKNPIRQDESEDTFRARLWTYCKIVCQSLNIWLGLYPILIPDAWDHESHQQSIIASLPRTVYWEHKLHRAFTKAVSAMLPITFHMEPDSPSRELRLLIDVFDQEMLSVGNDAADNLELLHTATSRLYVRAFEFFCPLDADSPIRLTLLYSIAGTVIEETAKLDTREDYASYSPYSLYLTVGLSLAVLLRLARSHIRLPFTPGELERLYFTGIALVKKRSQQNDDMDARCAVMFTKLWPSTNVFRQPDGSVDSHKTRVRNRGPMGLAFDCYWYWAVEFAGFNNPSFHKSKTQRSRPGHELSTSSASEGSPAAMTPMGSMGDLLNFSGGFDFLESFSDFPPDFFLNNTS